MSWLAVHWVQYFTHPVTPVKRRKIARSVLVVSTYVRAGQSRFTITFYSVFITLLFWRHFRRSQAIIIILSRWKIIWLMKNIKFPQPDVSLQPKHLQAVCSADTRVFQPLPLQVICWFHVHFYAPHPTALTVTAHTTYRSNSLHRLHTFFQIRKLSCFSQASRFLSYVFSPFSFLLTA